MADEMKKNSINNFDGAENDQDYLLVVKNLKKYFPIKSSFLKKTVGNVKQSMVSTSKSSEVPPWVWSVSPAVVSLQ